MSLATLIPPARLIGPWLRAAGGAGLRPRTASPALIVRPQFTGKGAGNADLTPPAPLPYQGRGERVVGRVVGSASGGGTGGMAGRAGGAIGPRRMGTAE